MVLQGHVTNENHYISTTRVPMATKLRRTVTYFDGLLRLKSHGLVRLRNKLKLLYLHYHSAHGHQTWRMMTYLEGLLTINSFRALITWSCKVTDKRKSLYLPCQSAYGHQTWQDNNVPWLALFYNVTWPFDHVVVGDHVTN